MCFVYQKKALDHNSQVLDRWPEKEKTSLHDLMTSRTGAAVKGMKKYYKNLRCSTATRARLPRRR